MSTGEHAIAPGPRRLGRYLLDHEMGSGGAGAVYAARDTELDVQVCVKTFHEGISKSPNTLLRIKREVLLSRRVSHPGVCRVFDFQSVDGQPLVIMEYVEGRPMYELMHVGEPMPLGQALDMILQLTDAVAAAHDVDVVHRDLKPDNILVTPEGRTKIIDFGIATAGDMEELTSPGVILGTLDFIAPEIWTGERADAGADIWALGTLAYLLLSGRLPYEVREDYGIYEAVKRADAVPIHELVPGLSPAVGHAIMGALEKDPNKRYRHGRLFHQALEAAMRAGTPTENGALAHRRAPTSTELAPLERITSAYIKRSTLHEEVSLSGPKKQAPAPRAVPWAWWAAGGAALVVLLVVAGWALWPDSADERAALEQARAAILEGADQRREDLQARRAAEQASAAAEAEAEAARAEADRAKAEAEAAKAEAERKRLEDEQARKRPTLSPGARALLEARRAMSKAGLIAGDDRALDKLMRKASADRRAGRDKQAQAHADEAKARIDKVRVDQAFVDKKLARLNKRFAKVKDQAARDKALPLFKAVAGQVRGRQWQAANHTLNRAFAALR